MPAPARARPGGAGTAPVVGGGFTTVTVGTVEFVVPTGADTAQAVGVHVNGSQNLATVSNSGTISVSAVNDGGATVTAALTTVLIALSRGSRASRRSGYGTVDSRAMNHEWG